MRISSRSRTLALLLALLFALTAALVTGIGSAGADHREGHQNASSDHKGCNDKNKEKNKHCEDGSASPPPLPAPFTDLTAFATKTGFRAVVAWSANEPVSGIVRYGTDPGVLNQIAVAPGPPDTAQLAILDGLTTGETYHFLVEDVLSGVTTPVDTFEATNAYTAYGPNIEDGNPLAKPNVYTVDLVVQLDSQSLPDDVSALQALNDIAAGINVLAERLYDALDGYGRIGNVLITDTLIDHAGTIPGVLPVHVRGACDTPTNKADFLITTSVPFDSHTFGYAINEPCTPFYVGRAGQLVLPWEGDLHFGYVATHEMMHYGFGAPDLYPGSPGGLATGADCRNLAWDGSLMYNDGGWKGQRWELTEVDRNQTLTPCTMGTSEFTWDRIQSRYMNVPETSALEDVFNTRARGNRDGGALNILVLDRELGGSTLTAYTPDDTNEADCGTPGSSTSFEDAQGDATWFIVDTGVPALNDPALDVLRGAVSYLDDGDGQPSDADTIRFEIEVDDLRELPATGSHGEHFDFGLSAGGDYLLVASWDRTDPGPVYQLQQLAPTRMTVADTDDGIVGTWNLETDVITIDLPAVIQDAAGNVVFGVDGGSTLAGFGITSRRIDVVIVPDADHASGGCPVAVPGDPLPPPPPPPADGSLSPESPEYTWSGGPTTDVGLLYPSCDDGISGDVCDEELVDVTVPVGGATLTVSITADLADLNDFDLLLYAPNGTLLDESANAGSDETISVDVTASGVYKVVVRTFTAVEASYDGLATLS